MMRRLWLHAETDKAIMVDSSPLYHQASKRPHWVPRSQIKEIRRWVVPNPLFGTAPQIVQFLGTAIEFDCPGWLLDRLGLSEDADIPEPAAAES